MELRFEPEKDLKELARTYGSGEGIRFVLLEEVRSETEREVLAIISDDTLAGHVGMLEHYHNAHFENRTGTRLYMPVEPKILKPALDSLFLGGGFINRDEIVWQSDGCNRIFRRVAPPDADRADRLLMELRVQFDTWLATMAK